MFTELSKNLLNLKYLVSKNKAAKNYESFILDCSIIIAKFGISKLKKVIKMLLFCVGTKRYDFERVIYLKIDLGSIDIESFAYIVNLIRFTGRKEQVKICLVTNDKCLAYKDKTLDLKQYANLTLLPNLNDLSLTLKISRELEIYQMILSDINTLETCKYLLNNHISILYSMEEIIKPYLFKIYSIKMEIK